MSEEKKQDEIVISLDTLGVPIAIIVAGLIIAGGIFFANRNASNVDDTPNENATVAGEDTTTDNSANEYAQYMKDNKSVNIDDDPYLGNKETAKVAMVEFSDYQCGYCGRHTSQVVPTIIENDVNSGEVLYVFRDYQMYGEVSETTAKVGEYIADKSMDDFLTYHEEAYSVESVNDAYDFASDLGYNVDDLKAYVATSESQDEVEKDFADGQAVGITGTPAFIIGVLDENGNVDGKLVSGALPYEAFEQVIDEMLNQ